VILRNLLEHRDDADAFNVRIGATNVDVETIKSKEFSYDMENENDEDLQRKVRLASQQLAYEEDKRVLRVMKPTAVDAPIDVSGFSKAKKVLGDNGVHSGFGAVVSTDGLSALETQALGVKSGLDLVESMLSTKVAQSNGLPEGGFEAIVLQASPAAFRMVHAASPRVRVTGITSGKSVQMQVEERIAVGELEPGHVVGIRPPKEAKRA
jgi:hypothetical protein